MIALAVLASSLVWCPAPSNPEGHIGHVRTNLPRWTKVAGSRLRLSRCEFADQIAEDGFTAWTEAERKPRFVVLVRTSLRTDEKWTMSWEEEEPPEGSIFPTGYATLTHGSQRVTFQFRA